MIVTMLVGGMAQGGNLAHWDQVFSSSFVNSSAYVVGRALAWGMISFSNLLFLYQFGVDVPRERSQISGSNVDPRRTRWSFQRQGCRRYIERLKSRRGIISWNSNNFWKLLGALGIAFCFPGSF